MSRSAAPNRPDCLVRMPLNQFKPGQTLMFKYPLGGGHYLHSTAEFIRVWRGLVELKPVPPWEPEYVDSYRVSRLFPKGTVMVRAKSCYLWGRDDQDRATHPHCHWFKDTKNPVI